MRIPDFGPDLTVAELVDALDAHGCAVIHGLFSRARIDRIHREFGEYFARTPCGEGLFFGRRTKRLGGVVKRSRGTTALILQETILKAVSEILLRSCESIQLNLTQAIQIGPGEPQQIVHKDDELFPFDKNGHQFMINAMWALDDFTSENGATRVVPGSHLREVDRMPDPATIVPAVMPSGSVLLYLGSLDHCGGPNTSDRPRTGLAISYNLGWLRQAENQYLSVPPAVARELPEQLQRLLGYSIHRPNLGWYEGQDPIVTLADEVPETLPCRDYFSSEAEAGVRDYYQGASNTA